MENVIMYKYCLISLSIIFSMYSHLAYAEDKPSTIETLYVYSEYGDGDIVFTTKNKDATCYGYWVNPNYGGAKAVYSALLSAFLADTKVELTVHKGTDEKWAGSSNHYCRVIRVALDKSF